MALPSAPFDAAKSIFAGRSIISFTPTGGAAKIFESRLLTHKDDSEFKHIERPDSAGTLRRVRTVKVRGGESWTFEVDEAKRLLSDLFGGALSGIKTGVCTLFMPDPQDATGKVALESETGFSATLVRDGDLKFGDGDFTKATIILHSNKQGAVTFTADADIT